eukprot:scaffold1170_cov125-Skeletonema_marinoi.AAC.1
MRGDREDISCPKCNQNLPDDGNEWIYDDVSDPIVYGTLFYTCCGCLKHYCYECEINGERRSMISDCHTCDRDYCIDCIEMHSVLRKIMIAVNAKTAMQCSVQFAI